MSDHRALLELADLYALGPLDPVDRERLEAHLEGGCPVCEAAIRRGVGVTDLLVHRLPTVDPSPELRSRLFSRVEADVRVAERVPLLRSLRLARYALAAGLVVAAALGVSVAILSGALGDAQDRQTSLEIELARERSEKNSVLARLTDAESAGERTALEMAALRATLGHLTSEQTRAVALAGQGKLQEASARAYLDPESRRLVVFVYDLPALPAGKTYQLWVIAEGQPASAGVFELDAAGRTQYETISQTALEGAVTIAVTIEPEGGVPQPTGPIVLAGT